MSKQKPVVELTIPVMPDMELLATQTSAAVAKHMNLDEEKTAEINMALSEACINAFEHSESKSEIEIHFKISDDRLIIQVTDSGKGFDKSKVDIPNIEEKISKKHEKNKLTLNHCVPFLL